MKKTDGGPLWNPLFSSVVITPFGKKNINIFGYRSVVQYIREEKSVVFFAVVFGLKK